MQTAGVALTSDLRVDHQVRALAAGHDICHAEADSTPSWSRSLLACWKPLCPRSQPFDETTAQRRPYRDSRRRRLSRISFRVRIPRNPSVR